MVVAVDIGPFRKHEVKTKNNFEKLKKGIEILKKNGFVKDILTLFTHPLKIENVLILKEIKIMGFYELKMTQQ